MFLYRYNIASRTRMSTTPSSPTVSSESMEGISLPLIWRVKAKSSSSFIPFLGSIDILFFRFKRFGKYAFHANNKTCLVLRIFCKMAFESTTKTISTSTPQFLGGIDVSASWISFNWLRPRLSAHFMNQTISRSGLRKCDWASCKDHVLRFVDVAVLSKLE